MRSFIGIIKRRNGIIKRVYDLYNSLPILIFILPYIILCLMLFSTSASESQDMVNLGLVGHWINDYGYFHSVKVLKGEELPHGEKGVDYAFCASEKGMAVFGIYKNSNAQPGGSLRTYLKAFFPVGYCNDIEVKPDESGTYGKAVYAYLAAGVEGIHIINISDLEMPQYIAGCDTPGSAQGIAVAGDYVFVADGVNVLQIIDISDKTSPVIAGSCDTPGTANGGAQGITLSGDYAFVADGDSSALQVIDISDKTQPVITGSCDTPGNAWGVTISGDYALVADRDSSALQIIDISDKTQPVITGSCDTLDSAKGVTVSGDYAFVADRDNGLQIIDISDKTGPMITGSCDTPGYAEGVAVSGDYAFVADYHFGLQIIDISDKTDPMIAGSFDTPGYAEGVAVSGDYAFVADRDSGLQIIDISDKNHPMIAGSCDRCCYVGVAVSGDYAFVVNWNNGLQIIDISDKTHPVIVGSSDTPDRAYGVAVSGEYAFVVNWNSGLQIIDISDKTHPVIVGSSDTPDRAYGVAVSGDYAFVADRDSGLQIIDISDKSSPVIIGSCDTPDWAYGVAVSGDYAFVADSFNGLQIIDISDKIHPVIVGSSDTPDRAYGVAVSGDYAFVADYLSGLQIIDISDKTHPVIVVNYDTPHFANGVAVSGDYAFVVDGDSGLQIIDISDKSGPVIIGSCGTRGSANEVAVSGDYAFVADGGSGLQSIDISDKSSPVIVGSCGTRGSAKGVAVSGDYAFVAGNYSGLQIIDISDKNHPVIVGSCDTPGSAEGVTVSGDYAFVANYLSGLQIIDISDKTHPVIVGSYDTPHFANEVAVSGDYAFVADGDSGLQIIDISDKSGPVIVGSCDTPGYARGVAVSGEYAFVADYDSGLQIIDISDKSGPVIIGSCGTHGLVLGVAVSGNYAFVTEGYSGLQIIDISDKTHPVIVGRCITPGYAERVTVSGDYAFVADGRDGLLQLKINFGPSPKANLILLNGGGINQNEEYWDISRRISNGIFNTFIGNGYEVYDIYYLTSGPQDVDNDGVPDQMAVDGLNEKTELESIIKKLPDGHISNTGPLYLALVGHGAEDKFQIRMDGNNILSAQELKTTLYEFLSYEYPDPDLTPPRPIVVILESAASGSFIDDLSGLNDLYPYPYLDLTVITSTGHGASYIKPPYDPNNPLPISFTSLLMRQMENYSLEDYQSSLKEAFIRARDKLYFTYSNPFLDQAPQMYISGGPIAFVLEDPNSPKEPNSPGDPNSPVHKLIITKGEPVNLTPVAIYPDGSRINLDPGRLILLSSKPQVLDPGDPNQIQITNGRIILTPEKDGIITFKNGITSLIAYPDPDCYDPYPDILLTAHLSIEVLIPGNSAAGGDKAIIVTGYRTQQGIPDTLWDSTNIIGNHAYESLRKKGYSRDDIIYLNPYSLQDVDRNSEYDDIHRIPSKENMDWAFGLIEKTGAERLLILLVDHGNKETFVLNPKENLSAEYLGERIASLIPNSPNRNSKHIQGHINLIIDACYSGSFIIPLGGYIQKYNGDPNQLIIITSAGPEQYARFSADGMISFSYPFFDEFLLSNSIYNAFTYAKNHIPPSGQTPLISDPDLAQKMNQGLIYYIDEVRPLIRERDFYRERGRLGIHARVFSLSGIERVCALITSSAQALSVAQGGPLTDEPVICLEPEDPNPYGGSYFIEIDDPYPDAYNYQLILSVKDKKGMIVTERTNLNNQGRNKTGAIILVSDLGSVKPYLKYMIDDQSHRVYCILRDKHLKDQDIYYVKTRECRYAEGIDDDPASFDIQHIQTWPQEKGYQTFLIYLIGESQGGLFKLDNENLLRPQAISENINLAQGCRLLLFCEFPDPRDFLGNVFLCNECSNWTGIATPSIDPHRPLFSNYFFSRLYSFDSIGEAFIRAYKAFMPYHLPSHYIYPQDHSWNFNTIGRRLAYSLGDPALMGDDPSLIRSTEVREEDDTITLILTVNEFADVDANTPSAELHTISGEIYTIPLYQTDIYKWGSTLHKDRTYSRVIFHVQQIQDANRPGIIDWREYLFIASPGGSHIDPNGRDHFEPDDTPGEAKPIWVQVIDDPLYHQQHTFHNPNDADWVWFYALKDETYGITAIDPNGMYLVRISLFDPNNMNEPLSSNPWYRSWKCPKDGYYYVKAEPASAGVYSFSYSLWIEDEFGGIIIKPIGDIYGRVLNEKNEGINNLLIHIKNPSGESIEPGKTGSIMNINYTELDSSKTEGWFFFDNLPIHTSYEITVTTEDDTVNILAGPVNVYLSLNNVERVPDIIIERAESPEYPLGPEEYNTIYTHWRKLLNGNYPPWEDNDNDGFTNEEEFLNGTHPDLLTLKCSLYPGLNLFPFYYSYDSFKASTFFNLVPKECCSIWRYDNEAHYWNYWPNEGSINFPLETGRGYIIYKHTKEVIYQDVNSIPGPLAPGINILPVSPIYDPNYTSHRFIRDKKGKGARDISISRYNNNEEGVKSKGDWETSYMFFGRLAGKDFEIKQDKAYLIHYQKFGNSFRNYR